MHERVEQPKVKSMYSCNMNAERCPQSRNKNLQAQQSPSYLQQHSTPNHRQRLSTYHTGSTLATFCIPNPG